MTLICMWLVELYINKLNIFRDQIRELNSQLHYLSISTESGKEQSMSKPNDFHVQQQDALNDEFRSFLRQYKVMLKNILQLN